MPVTKYSPEFRADLLAKFEVYIDGSDSPLIKEFALQNDIPQSNLYNFTEFAEYLKKAVDKTEVFRIRELDKGRNILVHFFLLKTMYGYRESTPIQLNTGDSKYLTVNITGKSKDELEDLMTKRLRQIKSNRVVKQKK